MSKACADSRKKGSVHALRGVPRMGLLPVVPMPISCRLVLPMIRAPAARRLQDGRRLSTRRGTKQGCEREGQAAAAAAAAAAAGACNRGEPGSKRERGQGNQTAAQSEQRQSKEARRKKDASGEDMQSFLEPPRQQHGFCRGCRGRTQLRPGQPTVAQSEQLQLQHVLCKQSETRTTRLIRWWQKVRVRLGGETPGAEAESTLTAPRTRRRVSPRRAPHQERPCRPADQNEQDEHGPQLLHARGLQYKRPIATTPAHEVPEDTDPRVGKQRCSSNGATAASSEKLIVNVRTVVA